MSIAEPEAAPDAAAQDRHHVELSVVVPVLNGAGFIGRTLPELAAYLQSAHPSSELIVVDDGSTDATAREVAQAAAAAPLPVVALHHAATQGKGAAVRTGMSAARGRRRVFIDADLAYPPAEITAVLAGLEAGADVVIASRVHPESRYLIRPSFFRYLYTRHISGRLFNWLARLVLLPGIADTQAGLKGFTASAARALFAGWMPRGFGFDLAILARARRLGLAVASVPVTFRYDREPTTMRFLADTVGMVRDIALVRLRVGHGGVVEARGDAGGEPATAEPATPVVAPWRVLAGSVALLCGVEAARTLRAPLLVPLALWLAALGLWLGYAFARDRAAGVPRVRWFEDRRELLLVLAITLLASALRLVALSTVPSFMHHDTASCGLVGRELLSGAQRDPFALAEGWYHFPYLGLLPYALSLKLLGTTVLALRLTSAIPGILAVVALYFLVRGWFGRVPAGVAALLLATNHVAVHFSRTGIWNIHALLLGVAGLAALFGAWRRGSAFWIAAAGVCCGLTLYTYTAGRLFFGLGVLAVLALSWKARPRAWRLAACFVVALAATVAPLATSFVRQPLAFQRDRVLTVSPFAAEHQAHVASQVGSSDTAAVLAYQVRRTLGGFTHLGDTDSNYGTGRPVLSPVTLALALLGLGFGVVRLPDRRFAVLLAWLGAGLLFGGVLAINPPSFPRLLAILPVPLVLAAVVVGLVWEKARALGPVLHASAGALVVAVALTSLVVNVRGYLRFVARVDVAVNEWAVLEVLQDLRPARTVYLFTGMYMLGDSPVFELFRDGRRLITGLSPADLPDSLAEPTAFVLIPALRDIGVALTERFPLLERETRSSRGVWQMTVYTTWSEPGTKGEGT